MQIYWQKTGCIISVGWRDFDEAPHKFPNAAKITRKNEQLKCCIIILFRSFTQNSMENWVGVVHRTKGVQKNSSKHILAKIENFLFLIFKIKINELKVNSDY